MSRKIERFTCGVCERPEVEFLWPTQPDGSYGARFKVTHAEIEAWSRLKRKEE